jgi:hypothetical protein
VDKVGVVMLLELPITKPSQVQFILALAENVVVVDAQLKNREKARKLEKVKVPKNREKAKEVPRLGLLTLKLSAKKPAKHSQKL